jgi:hypothetical protein
VQAEYSKACAAIAALVSLDASISSADLDAGYPDGAKIFDPPVFHWAFRDMARALNLPSLSAGARAAWR